jgi:alpha-glucosidase
MLMLALPGSAYVYAGEELGLPDHLDLPAEARQDPTFHRTGGAEHGRDGCRVPLPWAAEEPAYGFSPTGASWLPQPEGYRRLSVDRQLTDQDSTVSLYRRCTALRSERGLGRGAVEWEEAGDGVVAFTNRGVRVVVNLGDEPVALPDAEHLVLSDPEAVAEGRLRPDSAVWQW